MVLHLVTEKERERESESTNIGGIPLNTSTMLFHLTEHGLTNLGLGFLSWFGGRNGETVLTLLTSLHPSPLPFYPQAGWPLLWVWLDPLCLLPSPTLETILFLDLFLADGLIVGAVRLQRQMEQDWYQAPPAPCPSRFGQHSGWPSGGLGCSLWWGGCCDITEICDSTRAGSPRSMCGAGVEGEDESPICGKTQ